MYHPRPCMRYGRRLNICGNKLRHGLHRNDLEGSLGIEYHVVRRTSRVDQVIDAYTEQS